MPFYPLHQIWSHRLEFRGKRGHRPNRSLGQRPVFRPELLEDRVVLTSTLYVDFGDRFPGGVLNTTVGALDSHVFGANPNIDGPQLSDASGNGYAAGTAVAISSLNALYGANAPALRSQMMELTRRFFAPFDISVVDLSATAQTVNGHSVRAAASLDDISSTLGVNEGDARNNDSYVIVGQFLIGASNDNPATFATNGYGGLATGTDIASNNNNDGTAFVLLIGSNDSGIFNGDQIAHEAGHLLGLEHVYRQDTGSPPPALTNTTATGAQYDALQQSELMSYLGYDSLGGFNVFSRFPMMEGDGNTDANVLVGSPTPYDQWANDPNIGAGLVEYITGTGAHDTITIAKTGPNSATVSVSAFFDSAYTQAIDAPGPTGNTYSYPISLSKPLLIDAGARNDRIRIDGDLGIDVTVRGMHGTDFLQILGKNAASASYVPGLSTTGLDGNPDVRGTVSIGSTTIRFQEFETAGNVTISDIASFSYTPATIDADIVVDSPSTGVTRVRTNGTSTTGVPLLLDNIQSLIVGGTIGNDSLTVDSTTGLVVLPQGIRFDGGAGFDELSLTQTGGTVRGTSRIHVGALPGSGQSVISDGGPSVTQLVYFQNIEPVIDNVPAASLAVSGIPGVASLLQAANAIDYSASQILAVGGRVTVDNFEPIEFNNKDELSIDAGAGSDEIHLNNATIPTGATPGGLKTISVLGQGPTASDLLIVNGVAGVEDALRYDPIALGSGTVSNEATPQPDVNFSGIEHLKLVVQEADGDDARIAGTLGNDRFAFSHGLNSDSGVFRGTMDMNNVSGSGPFALTETLVQGIDGSIADYDINVGPVGGVDRIEFNGTSGNDVIGVLSGETGGLEIRNTIANAVVARLEIFNSTAAILRGHEGDDSFVQSASTATQLAYEGGGPSGSDALFLAGTAGDVEDVTIRRDLVTPSEQDILGYGENIDVSGVEFIRYVGADADDSLTVVPGGQNDTVRVHGESNIAPDRDRVTSSSLPTIEFDDLDAFILNLAGGTDVATFATHGLAGATAANYRVAAEATDTVIVEGHDAQGDTYQLAVPVVGAAAVIHENSFVPNVTVTVTDGTPLLTIHSLGGNDSITATGDITLSKRIETGAGNDAVNLSASTDAVILGGIGDDVLIGSGAADEIFGGPGNDTIIGGGGVDYEYGEEGNDRFGNVSLNGDGVADDPGADFIFGGDGRDTFVWEPGDGSDVIQGGVDSSDVFRFFGSGADQAFTLTPSPSVSTHMHAILGGATIDTSGVETVLVFTRGGADDVTVNDLFTTEIASVQIDLFIDEDDADDVIVNGRSVSDSLNVSVTNNVVKVAGLKYDVSITGAAAIADDRLTVNGNQGNDNIKAQDGVEATMLVTLNGNDGDDQLSADAIIFGGPGNDLIIGGTGVDSLFGDAGDDTFVTGAGNDVVDGGDGFDTILVRGTAGNDRIDVIQSAAVSLSATVNGVVDVDTLVLLGGQRTIERVKIEAGSGDDILRVDWLDALGTDMDINSVRFDLDGEADFTRDRLAVVDSGIGDLVLYRKGESDDNGSITVGPGNPEPLEAVFQAVESVQPITPADGRIIVFKHDPFEFNDERFLATDLGSDAFINLDPSIDPGFDTEFGLEGDEDWYRVVAASTGTLDFRVNFEEIPTLANGRPGLPGNGNLDIEVTDVAGNLVSGFGTNDGAGEFDIDGDAFAEDERVRIPAVQGQTYFLRVRSRADAPISLQAINNYSLSIVSEAAPVPFDIELDDDPILNPPSPASLCPLAPGEENSDTGRSQFDNVTCDATPTIFLRLDDGTFVHDVPGNGVDGIPPDEVIRIPFRAGPAQSNLAGFAVGIFVEDPVTGAEVLDGFATLAGAEGVYTYTFGAGATGPLEDGSHFITARVQMIDPAAAEMSGFAGRSSSLEIVVDTVDPSASFGNPLVANDGLNSDTGVIGQPATFLDRVTSQVLPRFSGTAEANSIIRVTASDADGPAVQICEVVASPLDGTNQFPNGQWECVSTVDLNDPAFFAFDGLRTITVEAEDLAGNTSNPDILQIFIDTRGPQITSININNRNNPFNLFALKPATVGPTPLINALVINVRDLPNRILAFPYGALNNAVVTTPGQFVLQGDANGLIRIENISFTGDAIIAGQPATGFVTLTFDRPLPDDRFTLTIRDTIVDDAGNKLDGESHAREPRGNPFFPSGDGQPGGDFVARFTVDSRPEIGTWAAGSVYLDINGNFKLDPENADDVNEDLIFEFGFAADDVFAGNFVAAANGITDGFDKLAAYGDVSSPGTGFGYRWRIDFDNDGVPDLDVLDPANINGLPAAGRFDANDDNGDEVAVFTGRVWHFDTNHDFRVDLTLNSQLRGYPMVGDFNGDGFDDLGTYNEQLNRFEFDLTTGVRNSWDGIVDRTAFFGFAGVRERPAAADMDQDGIDDFALWAPDRSGDVPQESGEWFIFVSGGAPVLNRIVVDPALNVPALRFDTEPFANDLYATFGDEFALPVLGNFDPPLGNIVNSLTNPDNPLDVNADTRVNPLDALLVINRLSNSATTGNSGPTMYYDVDGNGKISPLDALRVINALSNQSRATGGISVESQGKLGQRAGSYAVNPVDLIFAEIGETDRKGQRARNLKVDV